MVWDFIKDHLDLGILKCDDQRPWGWLPNSHVVRICFSYSCQEVMTELDFQVSGGNTCMGSGRRIKDADRDPFYLQDCLH